MDPSALSNPQLQQLINLMSILRSASQYPSCYLYGCTTRIKFGLSTTNYDRVVYECLRGGLPQEKERAMANEMIAKLTSACWDKCVTGTPGSKFSSSESACLTNCAQRYMDMSIMIVKRFQSMH